MPRVHVGAAEHEGPWEYASKTVSRGAATHREPGGGAYWVAMRATGWMFSSGDSSW